MERDLDLWRMDLPHHLRASHLFVTVSVFPDWDEVTCQEEYGRSLERYFNKMELTDSRGESTQLRVTTIGLPAPRDSNRNDRKS